MSKKTRIASHDRYDGEQKRVCVSCHKMTKFCNCSPNAQATCPICLKNMTDGKHFPEFMCKEITNG